MWNVVGVSVKKGTLKRGNFPLYVNRGEYRCDGEPFGE